MPAGFFETREFTIKEPRDLHHRRRGEGAQCRRVGGQRQPDRQRPDRRQRQGAGLHPALGQGRPDARVRLPCSTCMAPSCRPTATALSIEAKNRGSIELTQHRRGWLRLDNGATFDLRSPDGTAAARSRSMSAARARPAAMRGSMRRAAVAIRGARNRTERLLDLLAD